MAPIPEGRHCRGNRKRGIHWRWVVKLLLDEGYRVRACVRDAEDTAKTTFLKEMPGYASGRLTLHSADLDQAGCFDEIFGGCHGVSHVSHISDYHDPDYVKRVCDHIIESVNQSGTVNRVIVTSSIAASWMRWTGRSSSNARSSTKIATRTSTTPSASPPRSATRSARSMPSGAFSDAAERNGLGMPSLAAPGDNVGPILSAHQKDKGPWQHLIELMLLGECEQSRAYRPWMPVDVRDDAECHIRLLESVEVKNGERYIAFSTDTVNVEEICPASTACCLSWVTTLPRS